MISGTQVEKYENGYMEQNIELVLFDKTANSLSSLSISTVRLLAATISLYSGLDSTGPESKREQNQDNLFPIVCRMK